MIRTAIPKGVAFLLPVARDHGLAQRTSDPSASRFLGSRPSSIGQPKDTTFLHTRNTKPKKYFLKKVCEKVASSVKQL